MVNLRKPKRKRGNGVDGARGKGPALVVAVGHITTH